MANLFIYRSNVFTILEKSKETTLEFYKGTAKVM